MLTKRPTGGFTLIELVITITVLAILTLGVVPLAQVAAKRQKETQLREALRQMREAIDQFHREALAGAAQQIAQQQGQQQGQERPQTQIRRGKHRRTRGYAFSSVTRQSSQLTILIAIRRIWTRW